MAGPSSSAKGGKQKEQSGGESAQSFQCGCSGCKSSPQRFGFCSEHFEQFKFGLIKKDGQPVPDWDKKFEHYQAYKQKQSARKVA